MYNLLTSSAVYAQILKVISGKFKSQRSSVFQCFETFQFFIP